MCLKTPSQPLLVKPAASYSLVRNDRYEASDCLGLPFVGTPHRGGSSKAGFQLIQNAARVIGAQHAATIANLQKVSDEAQRLNEAFYHIAPRYQTVSVYETIMSHGTLIVSETSKSSTFASSQEDVHDAY